MVWLLGCAALCTMQDQMIYPGAVMQLPPRDPPPEVEVLELEIAEGHVQAWFAPAPGNHAAPLVVYCHGNAELIDYQPHVIQRYHMMGFNVLLPEYRGFGGSDGQPSQIDITRDAVAFYDMVIDRPGVDATRVVFHGRSLGAGVAVDLATQRKPRAMILDTPFVSLTRMARRYLAPPFIVRHPYRTDRVLPGLNIPTMISHGANDEIIPVAHGRELAKMTPGAVFHEYDSRHNDFPGRRETNLYWQRVRAFVTPMLKTAPVRTVSPGR